MCLQSALQDAIYVQAKAEMAHAAKDSPSETSNVSLSSKYLITMHLLLLSLRLYTSNQLTALCGTHSCAHQRHTVLRPVLSLVYFKLTLVTAAVTLHCAQHTVLNVTNCTAQPYASDTSTGRTLSSADWLGAAAEAAGNGNTNGKTNGKNANGKSGSGASPSENSQNRWQGDRTRSRASHLTMTQLRAADKFTTLAFNQLTAVEDAAAEQYCNDDASASTDSEQVCVFIKTRAT
jgi:hypothetical protein